MHKPARSKGGTLNPTNVAASQPSGEVPLDQQRTDDKNFAFLLISTRPFA
jgi:hypothetical protein